MKIIKIKAKNFMCYENINIDIKNMVTLVTSNDDIKHDTGKSALIKAIEFIIDPIYKVAIIAKPLFKDPYDPNKEAYVKLTFRLPQEKDEDEIMIVKRELESINYVTYWIRGHAKILNIGVFQRKYPFHSSVIFPFLPSYWPEDHQKNVLFNYMHSLGIKQDTNFEIISQRCYTSILKNLERDDAFQKALTLKKGVLDMNKCRYVENLILIASNCNKAFQNILGQQYNLKFMVACEGNDLLEFTKEVLTKNLHANIIVFVEFENQRTLWNATENYIKFIVGLSVELGVAIFLKLKILFLPKVYKINDAQHSQILREVIIKNELLDKRQDQNIVYPGQVLQNIINECNKNNTQIFIEYAGDVFVENCDVIKCSKVNNTFECKVEENQMTSNDLVEIFENAFQMNNI